jgi:hypothetical protein
MASSSTAPISCTVGIVFNKTSPLINFQVRKPLLRPEKLGSIVAPVFDYENDFTSSTRFSFENKQESLMKPFISTTRIPLAFKKSKILSSIS